MKPPPYNDFDVVDAITVLLGVLLVIAILAAVVWLANDTGVLNTATFAER